jgi:hypothetical protein
MDTRNTAFNYRFDYRSTLMGSIVKVSLPIDNMAVAPGVDLKWRFMIYWIDNGFHSNDHDDSRGQHLEYLHADTDYFPHDTACQVVTATATPDYWDPIYTKAERVYSQQIAPIRFQVQWDIAHTIGFNDDTDYLQVTWPDSFVKMPKAQFVAIWSQIPITGLTPTNAPEGWAYARKWEWQIVGSNNVAKIWSPKGIDLPGGTPVRYMLNMTTLNDLTANGFTHPDVSGNTILPTFNFLVELYINGAAVQQRTVNYQVLMTPMTKINAQSLIHIAGYPNALKIRFKPMANWSRANYKYRISVPTATWKQHGKVTLFANDLGTGVENGGY